jgi:predicted DNA-binding protein (MmcQ/YjbR family)
MPEDDPLAAAEEFLRGRALAFPEAAEEFPWGHRAIKVKKKIFLILDRADGVLSVTVKLPDSGAYALMQPYAGPTGYGLGKSGWVSCRFNAGDEPPLDLLEEWLEESYRAVAPKKLVLKLNAAEGGAPEPPPAAKRGPKKGKKNRA